MTSKIVHKNVICKECIALSSSIVGWRYRCLVCVDYDLCEICFKYTNHDESHLFVTLKKACDFVPFEYNKPQVVRERQNSPPSRFDCFRTTTDYENERKKQQIIMPPKVYVPTFDVISQCPTTTTSNFSLFHSKPLFTTQSPASGFGNTLFNSTITQETKQHTELSMDVQYSAFSF